MGHEKTVVVSHGLLSGIMVMFVGYYAEATICDVQPVKAYPFVNHFELANG